MSSTVNNDKKGIFHWKKATTPTSASPSTSRPSSRHVSPTYRPSSRPASRHVSPTSRPSSRPASRHVSPGSGARALAASAAKPPLSPKVDKAAKITKHSASDTTLVGERVSRTNVHRYLEQPKFPNDVATSPRAKHSVISPVEPTFMGNETEPTKLTLKKSNQAENIISLDELSSPFKKVSDIIEDLDLSLNNIGSSESIDKHNDESSKIGDFVSARGSTESIESTASNDTDFSIAPESPLPHDPTQRLLKQIDDLVKNTVRNDNEAHKIHILLVQLTEIIAYTEEQNKRRIKGMKDMQDNAFADLFLEKNDQINQLKLDIQMMKQKNSKEIEKIKSTEELMATKDEVCRLREMLATQNTEINQLTYKLIDAQSYIESLEKEKYGQIEVNTDDEEDIRNHFKILKKSLLSNRTLLKLMQSRKPQCKT